MSVSAYMSIDDRLSRRIVPFEEKLSVTTSGLSGLGASGAVYDRINAVQNSLSVRLAEIAAADQALWDQVWTTLQGKTVPGTATPFWGWGYVKQQILDMWSKLTPTYSSTFGFTSLASPSLATIAAGEQMLDRTGQMVDYFKKLVPELMGKLNQEAAWAKQKVESIAPLRSPEEVGWETFQQDIKDRAAGLASSFSLGAGAVAAVAAIAAFLFFRGRG